MKQIIATALHQLAGTVFTDKAVKIVISDGQSQLRVADLQDVITPKPHFNTVARAA